MRVIFYLNLGFGAAPLGLRSALPTAETDTVSGAEVQGEL